jgi:hypothetical protein
MPEQLNQRMANQQDKRQAIIKQLSQTRDPIKISRNRKRGVRL